MMLFIAIAWLAPVALAQPVSPPPLSVTPARCDFAEVRAGEPVTCSFTVRNTGSEPRRVAGATLARPLAMKRSPAVIPAGGQVTLVLELPTGGLTGAYEGALTLRFADGGPSTLVLPVKGVVRQPIEFRPGPVFHLAGHHGEPASQSVEIVNRESTPVSLALTAPPPAGLNLRLEPLEPGRRYRLTLTLEPEGPLGQQDHEIALATSDPARPTISVQAHTWRRPRVYTFPTSVDMGAISLTEIAADPRRFAQTLMVYQRGGHDFDVRASIDTRAVAVRAARGPKGDRYQITLSYVPAGLALGPIQATVTLSTNDEEFARIDVPVRGTILPPR